eukprot:scaffold28956_cov69-Phaeocystis_antarctica.AAC.6
MFRPTAAREPSFAGFPSRKEPTKENLQIRVAPRYHSKRNPGAQTRENTRGPAMLKPCCLWSSSRAKRISASTPWNRAMHSQARKTGEKNQPSLGTSWGRMDDGSSGSSPGARC